MLCFLYTESTCYKKLQYFGVSLNVKFVTPLWRHNNKFTRFTKTFLNTYTWKFLKLHSIPNLHRNYKEKFCELEYFGKKRKGPKLTIFCDLIFIFLWNFIFFGVLPSLSEAAIFSLSLTFPTTDTGKLWW